MNALAPEPFGACFAAWVWRLREDEPDIVALDGQTSRRARRGEGHPQHIASAWATRQRLAPGSADPRRTPPRIGARPPARPDRHRALPAPPPAASRSTKSAAPDGSCRPW